MQKFFPNLLLVLIALSLCPFTAEISHAQTLPVTASLDLGGGPGAPADSNTGLAIPADPSSSSSLPANANKYEPAIEPVVSTPTKPPGVSWKGLTKDSLTFLVVMQGFRTATEPGTRAAFGVNPFFKGYINAVSNMHGFSDGDQFYVNYVGHPMQGAVSGFLWSNNDRAYKDVYFSRDRQYWKEKLRGAAFSYVFSVQFEIGPVSEASIGDMQSYYPAQGFVDHVVTPAIGMGWSIGEDVIDRYLVRHLEEQSDNRYLKIFARGLLNPARSFANILGGRYPWYRTNRLGVTASNSEDFFQPVFVKQKVSPPPGVAPFEFKVVSVMKTYLGSNSLGSCVGGGSGVAFRVAKEWQIASDVSGCKMTNLPVNTTGDSLTYLIGPRWSSQLSPRWNTHAQILIGGNKITQELIDPEKKRIADLRSKALTKMGIDPWPPPYAEFARSWDTNSFAFTTGAGLDLKFNNALSLRTALDYSHTWNRDINNINYRNSLQLSSGLVLNMGTW
jgi:hypothetical protein